MIPWLSKVLIGEDVPRGMQKVSLRSYVDEIRAVR